MSAHPKPMPDYVVVLAEEAQTKTSSGIFLPESAAEKPRASKVVAVGKNVKQIKVGDHIVYKTYSTTEVKLDKQDYVIIKEEDVVAIV